MRLLYWTTTRFPPNQQTVFCRPCAPGAARHLACGASARTTRKKRWIVRHSLAFTKQVVSSTVVTAVEHGESFSFMCCARAGMFTAKTAIISSTMSRGISIPFLNDIRDIGNDLACRVANPRKRGPTRLPLSCPPAHHSFRRGDHSIAEMQTSAMLKTIPENGTSTPRSASYPKPACSCS